MASIKVRIIETNVEGEEVMPVWFAPSPLLPNQSPEDNVRMLNKIAKQLALVCTYQLATIEEYNAYQWIR